eukprot:TRINITY_DN64401_c0_g1_i1.p1 TRINITY_DN64401_c0_g1~~TRINITY_DN64401_c0_g1_i1.p1  ORF type:complete len:479 (-),score=118.99 TRINITY_DN64401_c0_g1_i1:37-1473(-)
MATRSRGRWQKRASESLSLPTEEAEDRDNPNQTDNDFRLADVLTHGEGACHGDSGDEGFWDEGTQLAQQPRGRGRGKQQKPRQRHQVQQWQQQQPRMTGPVTILQRGLRSDNMQSFGEALQPTQNARLQQHTFPGGYSGSASAQEAKPILPARSCNVAVDVPVELDAAAEDEREVLEAIYGSEFEVVGPTEWRLQLPGPPGSSEAALRLLLPAGYPRSSEPPVPVFDCEGAPQGIRDVAAEVICELLEQWDPSTDGDGCGHKWVERLREALEPAWAAEVVHREELDAAAAEALAMSEAMAAEEESAVASTRAFTYLPAHPEYGQRRRIFDDSSYNSANAVEIRRGEPFTDRKSTFQAFAAKVCCQGQVSWVLRSLLEDRKVAAATHNIFAYRFRDKDRGVQVADNDDDGEDGAGSKLAELLNLAGCDEVFVMVSRWYGGIQLGPDRFKHICRAASTLLDEAGWSSRGRAAAGGTKKGK